MIAAYYDPDTNREMTRVGVDSRTVHRRDMQDVAAIKQTALCCTVLPQYVVSTPMPWVWGYCFEHTPAMCNDPLAVSFANGGGSIQRGCLTLRWPGHR